MATTAKIFSKILSFNASEIELGPLNVLIGQNAVGKTNLIEVVGLLQAASASISTTILRGGGVGQWVWLGDGPVIQPASIECELSVPDAVTYQIQFVSAAVGFSIHRELLAETEDYPSDCYFARDFREATIGRSDGAAQQIHKLPLSPTDSVLSQFRNPFDATPITRVGNSLAQIRIYREFRTGPQSTARYGIATNAANNALSDNGDNLALVLNQLDLLGVHERIREYLRRFCERFEDVKISLGDGLARTYLREAGLAEMLSAIRMSDGTLKFLSLLAALFHPNGPPLMCIEEPETGLHPDAMHLVAEALVEASARIQLIVTTHSEALVDALSDTPESVLICERDFDNGTQMKRLSREKLEDWLESYSLGQLWRKGEIGGGRY